MQVAAGQSTGRGNRFLVSLKRFKNTDFACRLLRGSQQGEGIDSWAPLKDYKYGLCMQVAEGQSTGRGNRFLGSFKGLQIRALYAGG
jgi:hypothetical protein